MDTSRLASLRTTTLPSGITCMRTGMILWVLAVLLLPFALRGALHGYIELALSFVLLGATVSNLVGKRMCLAAPEEIRGSGAVPVALGLDVLAVLFILLGFSTILPLKLASDFSFLAGIALMNVCVFVASVLAAAAQALLPNFLMGLAEWLQEDELWNQAKKARAFGNLLVFILAVFAVSFVTMPQMARLFFLLAAIYGGVVLILYLRLLRGFSRVFRDT